MNEHLMRKAGFGPEMDAVQQGKCPLCKKPINPASFRDRLSHKEWTISGMCQQCQDKFFHTDEDE